MKRVKQIFINLVTLSATALLLRTVGMAFQVYLSKKIGAEGIGLFQLIMSVYFLAVTIAVAGVRLAATRLVAEELGTGNGAGAQKALGVCLRYSLTLSIILTLLLFWSADFIGIRWLSDRRTILPLRILSLTLPFLAASSVYRRIFHRRAQGCQSSRCPIRGTINQNSGHHYPPGIFPQGFGIWLRSLGCRNSFG